MKKLKRLGAEAEASNMGRRFKASYDGDAQDVEEVIVFSGQNAMSCMVFLKCEHVSHFKK